MGRVTGTQRVLAGTVLASMLFAGVMVDTFSRLASCAPTHVENVAPASHRAVSGVRATLWLSESVY
jgi:hypothetical protein